MNPSKEIANVVLPKIRVALWSYRVNQNVARSLRAAAASVGLTRHTFRYTAGLSRVEAYRLWFGIKPTTACLLLACIHVDADLAQLWGNQPAVPQH
jgi:hypothetical protein